jgi:hypothetical protein
MLKKLCGAALLALPLAVLAQSETQLVERYTNLAGTKENATALVSGLRDGKEVTLVRGNAKESFTPPTGKMGYGNIDHALALAEASLQKQGITNPTPAELETALMGQGWGQIAQSLGFKLGEVKRAERADHVANVERPGRPEKPERPQRPDKPERPGKAR